MNASSRMDIQCEVAHKNLYKVHGKLNEFRKEKIFCDVEITVENRTFSCHRNVLSAASDYFRAMFGNNFVENRKSTVKMQGINADVFEEILNFIYTAEIRINDDNVTHLLTIGEYLGLEYIEDLCITYISNHIPIRKVVDILSFATRTNKLDLVENLYAYIAENFIYLSRTSELCNISINELKKILAHSKLRTNPDVTISFIVKWTKAQTNDIRQFLPSLLEYIDFQNVSIPCMTKILLCDTDDASESQEANVDAEPVVTFHARNRPSLRLVTSLVKKVIQPNEDSIKLFASTFEINERMTDGFKSIFDLLYVGSLNFYAKSITVQELLFSYCFNPIENVCSWILNDISNLTSPTHMKRPIFCTSFPVMASIGHNIYFYKPHVQETDTSEHVDILYVYDSNRDQWSSCGKMSGNAIEVFNLNMVSMDNSLYAIGGTVMSGAPSNINSDKGAILQHYDPRTDKWNRLPNALFEHIGGASCVYDNKIYVTGGDYLSYHKKVAEVFDPVAGKWCEIASMPIKKKHHLLVAYEEYLYAIGGLESMGKIDKLEFSTCVYNVRRNKWIGSFTIPTCRECYEISEIYATMTY